MFNSVQTPAKAKPILFGALVFFLLLWLPTPEGLTREAWSVVALAALMAIWWSTEAIPIPVTSLLPIVALPLLNISTSGAATAPYAKPVIFLLLGGFITAMAMQKWHLHRRIALWIVSKAGNQPSHLIAGFMAASAFLSMWISNTATSLMIIPIALTVANTLVPQNAKGHNFTTGLLIACAWAASIGGLGTYIGTPPNIFVKAFIEESTGQEILFFQWMLFAIPVVLAMLPLAWIILTKFAFRFDPNLVQGGQSVIEKERKETGAITPAEKRVAIILCTMAILWMTRQLFVNNETITSLLPFVKYLTDSHIAVLGALAMFLIPNGMHSSQTDNLEDDQNKGDFLLQWEDATKLPWGVLLLFGGGLSLASAIQSSGLAIWIGEGLSVLTTAPLFLMVFAIVLLVVFLTEFTSNTATTAALVPVMAAIATAGDFNPIMLAVPVAMSASCAFMLPVATGPNAVVFSSGYLKVTDMMRAGLYLNILGSFVVASLCYYLVPLIFNL